MSIGLPSIRMNKDGAERSSSNLIRKQTEYIRSGDQIKATKTQRGLAGTQNSAMRKMEAQRLAECFEWRLATHCEEEFDMFEVLEYEGDLYTRMLAKIQIFQDTSSFSCLHMLIYRGSSSKPWNCEVAVDKNIEDPLFDTEKEAELFIEVPEEIDSCKCALQ
eukprot:TRINITY_DN12700_c0_g1_i2.p1 TRINITY_DN12700_c0_g1~~TRINITY_DN12700_c0_g1_i2.p1  ORF type:complete len:162 (-),score=38.63 TRINITY_DN12700_c0_g1_i2:115-600(-)